MSITPSYPFTPNGPTIQSDVNQTAASFAKDVVVDQSLTVKGDVNLGTDANSKLGFYGTPGVVRPSAAGIVSVAQLITVLQSQGLLGP